MEDPDFDKGVQYWDGVEPTVKGVLGGFDNVARIDEMSSRMLLLTMIPSLSTISPAHTSQKGTAPTQKEKRIRKVLDGGAGIGRVSRSVLVPFFDRIDVVESSQHFIDQAVKDAASWRGVADQSKGVRFWKTGLQFMDPSNPNPEHAHAAVGASDGWQDLYDVIWIQWCVGHLSDEQLVGFLKRSRAALKKDKEAFIFVKENNSREHTLFDESDSSITRTDADFKSVFEQAGLVLVREEVQHGFPDELFAVKTCVFLSQEAKHTLRTRCIRYVLQ